MWRMPLRITVTFMITLLQICVLPLPSEKAALNIQYRNRRRTIRALAALLQQRVTLAAQATARLVGQAVFWRRQRQFVVALALDAPVPIG
ncbi:hypothetical protein D3C85_1605820 [compost metagenome]